MDLGEVVLMPGLVNAHCHLDYTDMAGQLPPPKLFSDWLRLIVATKQEWSYSDYASSWLKGAEMLVRSGTTTVGDIEAVPELLPEVWTATPLRVFSFIEMIGFTPRRTPEEILDSALKKTASLKHPRCRTGLSPHAPYSTTPALLSLVSRRLGKHRVSIHVAESDLEWEMFARGSGEMFNWLRASGREVSDCGTGSPVRKLEEAGLLGGNVLAVHANYLGPGDIQRLAQGRVNVVHCPRSHTYFQHKRFPLASLRRAGVNVCLGTDSLATVYKKARQSVQLSMFDEMRELAHKESGLSPNEIVRMATVKAALALGLAGSAGELSAGAFADLIAVPYSGERQAFNEHVVHFSQPVSSSMIGGKWVVPPP
jgi:cytosine/adenosine deaminase-related metal-dependent hydrolase